MRLFPVFLSIGLMSFVHPLAFTAGDAGGADVVLRIGGTGHRPYVALWIEDGAGNRIRTLHVWGSKPKHQKELREWKKGAGKVDGISGATRPNGDYGWTWDGLDDDGNPVPFGPLVFCAESAREDGAHCQTRLTLNYTGIESRANGESDRDIQGLFVRSPPAPRTEPEGNL